METLQNIILANLGISLLSFAGVFLLALTARNKTLPQLLVSFAAGVMLSAAFMLILPEAFEGSDPNFILMWVFFGMIGAFLMERMLLWYHCHHEHQHDMKPASLLVLLGDGIHNFVDGFAIAASFLVNPALGLTTTLAIAAHEIPQELADFAVLMHGGMKKRKALMLNFASALMAVVGGVVGFYFLENTVGMIQPALAITGGLFIYIASSDLIPELHRENKRGKIISQTLPFILGILLIVFIAQNTAHGHAENGEDHEEEYDYHIE